MNAGWGQAAPEPPSTTGAAHVGDLRIAFPGQPPVVDGVGLTVHSGRVTALIGQSGSGKTLTARALAGLLPADASVTGRIELNGRVLLNSEAGLRWYPPRWNRVRGREIGMVFQNALSALNPVLTVGRQVGDVVRRHDPGLRRHEVRERAIELLARAGMPDPVRRARSHPLELSGGMRQRAVIAVALAARPRLLVADEPTTALDTTVAAQILDLLGELGTEGTGGLLLITHDIGVVADRADDVVVLYQGRVVERGPAERVLDSPEHPYTRALLAAVPRPEHRGGPLPTLADFIGGTS
ncbi:ABC transporter ATP-binding protein [Pseudonocardia sp. HH130630-07]|uniref:ABC transporter ATP-binding protein n=1 Tax=Pseudonocardia sp. HH130630-07 TaxID=1690815 RepID=UPI00081519E4|nr:ABC transporter ATP-binding protein [Pseudonocardia sp. HH130630-07]ANY07182.1 hypothetical protein AFB00_13825 [Pseudonocardia sp. HH130630-07]